MPTSEFLHFNGLYSSYESEKASYRDVKMLMARTREVNTIYSNQKFVNLVYKSLESEEIINLTNKIEIDTNKCYKIEFSKFDDEQYVSEILVTELEM